MNLEKRKRLLKYFVPFFQLYENLSIYHDKTILNKLESDKIYFDKIFKNLDDQCKSAVNDLNENKFLLSNLNQLTFKMIGFALLDFSGKFRKIILN
jgi:hypothetical protein